MRVVLLDTLGIHMIVTSHKITNNKTQEASLRTQCICLGSLVLISSLSCCTQVTFFVRSPDVKQSLL